MLHASRKNLFPLIYLTVEKTSVRPYAPDMRDACAESLFPLLTELLTSAVRDNWKQISLPWVSRARRLFALGSCLCWSKYKYIRIKNSFQPTFGCHKVLGSSWIAAKLAASQEGLSSVSVWWWFFPSLRVVSSCVSFKAVYLYPSAQQLRWK
jgi:hypothetical protein